MPIACMAKAKTFAPSPLEALFPGLDPFWRPPAVSPNFSPEAEECVCYLLC